MVIKKYRSSRKKTNTKTKKYKESLKISSFSAVEEISGGGKIRKNKNQQLKFKKTKVKKYRLRKSLHLPDDMIYVIQEVQDYSQNSQEV